MCAPDTWRTPVKHIHRGERCERLLLDSGLSAGPVVQLNSCRQRRTGGFQRLRCACAPLLCARVTGVLHGPRETRSKCLRHPFGARSGQVGGWSRQYW